MDLKIIDNHWEKQWINVTGGSFAIPPDCPVCRAFEALFDTEAMPGIVATQREMLTIGFRDAHHNPLYAMVDRDKHLMKRLQKGGWPTDELRAVAYLIALVGPECGHGRPFETESGKR